MLRLSLLLACLATPLAADTLMSGDEFDAYTTGRTLTFKLPDGDTHGIEQYLPNRQVIWSTGPNACSVGRWFEKGSSICFIYENDPDAKCWFVHRTDQGLRAEYADDPNATVLFETIKTAEPLVCPGPDMLS